MKSNHFNTKIMTPLIKIFIAFTLLLSGNNELVAQIQNNNSVQGNGNVITKTAKTLPYNSIVVSGAMEVYLEKGTEGNVSITAEDNVLERVVIESDGEKLTISMKNNTSIREAKKIKITVPVEDIAEISLNGSGTVKGKDILEGNSISLNLLGSGKIDIKVDATTVDAKLHGSGLIQASGAAKDIEVKTTGSGNFSGKELLAENAQIYISGSGDSSVYAKNSLKARIQGSGAIYYLGNPSSNDVKVIGSGKVKPL